MTIPLPDFRRAAARLGIVLFALLLAAGTAGAFPATVWVDTSHPVRRVPATLFGSNLQWEFAGDGALILDGDTVSWRAGLLEAMAAGHIGALRFPGGFLADTYQWRAGIGPHEQRTAGRSFSGRLIPSDFGTDEFIRLCRASGVTPLVTVNFSSSPEDAAAWVAYLNAAPTNVWGDRRRANGLSAPLGVRYWEIGNEVYSPNEPGHVPPEIYGGKLLRFAAAMRAQDPGIQVGADLEVSLLQAPWRDRLLPGLAAWNDTVLATAGPAIDFASLHFYAPFDHLADRRAWLSLLLAGPDLFRDNLARLRTILQRHQRGEMPVWVTEFGVHPGEDRLQDPLLASTDVALFDALMLLAFLQHPQVEGACNWSLLNNGHFGMLEGRGGGTHPRPLFAVYRELGAFTAGTVVTTRVEAPTYHTAPKGNLPAMADLSLLVAVAAVQEDRRLVALVNRSPQEAAAVRIHYTTPGPTTMDLRLLAPLDTEKAGGWAPLHRERLHANAAGEITLTLPPLALAVCREIPPANSERPDLLSVETPP